jgi:hypothetical protein
MEEEIPKPSLEFLILLQEFLTEEENKKSSSLNQEKLLFILDYCKNHKFALLNRKEIETNEDNIKQIDIQIDQMNQITNSILQYIEVSLHRNSNSNSNSK